MRTYGIYAGHMRLRQQSFCCHLYCYGTAKPTFNIEDSLLGVKAIMIGLRKLLELLDHLCHNNDAKSLTSEFFFNNF